MKRPTINLFDYFKIKVFPKVNTFIVGAQKGGTSALYTYLGVSPEVSCGLKKEIGFFSSEEINKLGITWYERQFFSFIGKPKILLDATPEYLYYPSVPKLIYKYNSEAKIIVLLRNPVTRAYSHYNMFKLLHDLPAPKKTKVLERYSGSSNARPIIRLLRKKEFPEFLNLLKQETQTGSLEPSFIRRGLYYDQVKRYLELFPRKQVLILESSDLMDGKLDTLNKICSFLGISPEFLIKNDFEKKHVSRYSRKIGPLEKELLTEIYREPNEKLFDLINKRFDWNDPCN